MNKRRGTFLVIMSIATLIIAIVGATFAYFTATVTGDTPITTTSYKFATTLSMQEVLPKANPTNNMIPLDDTDLFNAIEQDCIDDKGYLVCKVYEMTLTNSGAETALSGVLEVTENTGFTNLKYQLLEVSNAAITGSNAGIIPAFVDNPKATTNLSFEAGSAQLTLTDGSATPTTKTYRMVIWLSNQQTAQDEQGKTFAGNIIFNSVSGSQLVGQISYGK